MERPAPNATLAPLGRIAWTILGPMVLLVITLLIVLKSSGWITVVDVAFFAVLGLCLLGRWLEFRGRNPQTAYGEPATAAHLRRYLLVAPILGLSIWILANILGNHVVTGWQ